jgi:hypothetical protein
MSHVSLTHFECNHVIIANGATPIYLEYSWFPWFDVEINYQNILMIQ